MSDENQHGIGAPQRALTSTVVTALLGTLSLAACGATMLSAPMGTDHPASPLAAEAALPELETRLGTPGLAAVSPDAGEPGVEHGHGRSTHTAGDAAHATTDQDPSETRPTPSANRSPAEGSTQKSPAQTGGRMYVCPMHPDVREPAPGRCPICGMFLVEEGTHDHAE